jgi:DNA anti-recombination protein RmuC
METLYIVIGALSSIFIFLLGYGVIGVFNGKKRIDDLERYIEVTDARTSELNIELSQRLDKRIDDLEEYIDATDNRISELTRDVYSMMDSRLDKLETKLKGLIPPTNEQLEKRIEKIQEEFYSLRMNL